MQARDPRLRALFVEGSSDRASVLGVLGSAVPRGTVIWSVDQVDVDVPATSAGGGMRRLVVDICRAATAQNVPSIVGLVDRNFERSTEIGSNLVLTVAPDLEFDILDIRRLRRLVEMVSTREVSAGLIPSALLAAGEIFAVRRIGWEHGLPIALPDLRDFLSLKGSTVRVNSDDLLAGLDARNRTGSRWRALKAQVLQELHSLVRDPVTLDVGFHTFEEVLEWGLRSVDKFPSRVFRDDWLGVAIRAQAREDLALTPLFIRLLAKLNLVAPA